MQLTQVVPRMGPWDGVGDYAARLGEALQRGHGVTSRFVEAGGADGRKALDAALESGPLLLHYVGYGYARRGAPLWLARSIERRPSAVRLGVVFHELFAMGRPWQSSFWLSGLQKQVVQRLARTCEGALFTREASRQWLHAAGALDGRRVTVLPISSNVGEPREVRAASQRLPRMVVWGSVQARALAYGPHWQRVVTACAQLGIATIVDVGPPTGLPQGAGPAIESVGRLDAAALSELLLDARFGLVVYPASFLAKSSIFGAYAAHGVVPLVLDDEDTPDLDGLAAGQSYLRLGQVANGGHDEVARRARAWYAGHDTAAHADAVVRLLSDAPT